jgi:hypothetical protein
MLLAIFQGERVYEGNENFLNAIYPMPSLSKTEIDAATEGLPDALGLVQQSIFREDSFDPTTRIRRGRFYIPDNPSRRIWIANRVNHYPYAPPVGGSPQDLPFESYRSFQPLKIVNSIRSPTVSLGDLNYKTRWHIIGAERLFNGETLFTLKATSSLGALPDLIESALPEGSRKEVAEGYEKVADAVHKYLPVSIVDVCREFSRIVLAVWLPTVGLEPKGDLGDLIGLVPSPKEGVSSATKIINRLHSRGKSSVHERQAEKGSQIRRVSVEDGELSVSLVAFLLREVGWAL